MTIYIDGKYVAFCAWRQSPVLSGHFRLRHLYVAYQASGTITAEPFAPVANQNGRSW